MDGWQARAEAIDDALRGARAKGIVLDLRGNRGGVDKVAFRVLAGLAEGTAKLGAYRVLVAPETLARQALEGSGRRGGRVFPPQQLTVPALAKRYPGKIAVVVDAALRVVLRDRRRRVARGSRCGVDRRYHAGSSGAPLEVPLAASKGSRADSDLEPRRAEGKPIEDDGVAADLDAVATPDALAANHDVPLDTAIAKVTP